MNTNHIWIIESKYQDSKKWNRSIMYNYTYKYFISKEDAIKALPTCFNDTVLYRVQKYKRI